MQNETLDIDTVSVTPNVSESPSEGLAYVLGEDGEDLAALLLPRHTVSLVEGVDTWPEEPAEAFLLSNVLQLFPWKTALGIIGAAVAMLKPFGMLHLATPSADWAAREYRKAKPSPAAEFVLHGRQFHHDELFRSHWTLDMLRRYMTNQGCIVRQASMVEAHWSVPTEKGMTETQYKINYVIGVRVNGSNAG